MTRKVRKSWHSITTTGCVCVKMIQATNAAAAFKDHKAHKAYQVSWDPRALKAYQAPKAYQVLKAFKAPKVFKAPQVSAHQNNAKDTAQNADVASLMPTSGLKHPKS